jgi:hypothetical protein
MHRAFPRRASSNLKYQLPTMQNLYWAEENNPCVAHLPDFDKQLALVKDYLRDAFDQLIKRTWIFR